MEIIIAITWTICLFVIIAQLSRMEKTLRNIDLQLFDMRGPAAVQ